VNTPMLQTLSRALDLTAVRQRLVSENIANIDTPGYRTRDIDFGAEFQRALGAGQDEPPVMVRTLRNLEERPDGNNVSIDRESLLTAQNQLQFQTSVAVLRAELNRLQIAINGGSNS